MVQRTVTIKVVKAQGLAAMDAGGKSDPYIVVKFGNTEHKTSTKKKTLDPEYNETFNVKAELAVSTVSLTLQVFDWNRLSSDKPMGTGMFDMFGLKKGVPTDVWVPLMKEAGKGRSTVKGAVHLQITPTSFGVDPNTPFVPKDYKPLLSFLQLTPAKSPVEDFKNIMAEFNKQWDNTDYDLVAKEFTVKEPGLHVENCLRRYYGLCFSENPAGVDKEGLKASSVDCALYYEIPLLAAPLVNETHFQTLWENFDRKDNLIPNLFTQILNDKFVIVESIKFTDAESEQIKQNLAGWGKTYSPKENKFTPLVDLFEIKRGDYIMEDFIHLKEQFRTKATTQRIMIQMMFESYYKPGKTTVTESEFKEFMQTAIPVFQLDKVFKSDDDSVKKLFKEVDKDGSGAIDQYEFLFWFDLKSSLELVNANNDLMDKLMDFSKLTKLKF